MKYQTSGYMVSSPIVGETLDSCKICQLSSLHNGRHLTALYQYNDRLDAHKDTGVKQSHADIARNIILFSLKFRLSLCEAPITTSALDHPIQFSFKCCRAVSILYINRHAKMHSHIKTSYITAILCGILKTILLYFKFNGYTEISKN